MNIEGDRAVWSPENFLRWAAYQSLTTNPEGSCCIQTAVPVDDEPERLRGCSCCSEDYLHTPSRGHGHCAGITAVLL